MKKIIVKILVFMIVFVGTVFFVNKLNNMNYDKATREMEEATLPLVYCQYEGNTLNLMNGYTHTMSTSLMRDNIIPLNDGYGVDLLVDDEYGYGSSYAYELRTIAGDSLIEHGELELKGSDGFKQQFFVRFRMDLNPNQEYVLVFIINGNEGETARYYTRVVNLKEQHLIEFVEYARQFHEVTFEKKVHEEEGNFVYDKLLPTGEGTTYDLSHVSLNSNYDMISWAGLEPVVESGIIPAITEVDRNYATVRLAYVISSVQGEQTRYYNVDEYYSVLYNEHAKQIEILAFDRYMESIFDESYVSKSRNSVSMGVAGASTEYVCADENNLLAFVKEGQLWLYSYNNASLTKVFGFSQGNYTDLRNDNRRMDVNIAGMDDEGNMYFVVYGYMNRGEHEGQNGISLYYYNCEESQIREKIFISCDEPFGIMKQEIGRFTYYDDKGHLYYLLDGSIYKIDVNNMTQDLIVSGLTSDKIMVSDSKKIIAYPETDEEQNVNVIHIMNFETGETYVEDCKSSERLMALGFVGNDLIYGVADKADIIISSYGEAILPLKKLFVVEPGGSVVKEYSKDGLYVMNTQVEEGKIYLQRAAKQNNFFETVEPDIITYKLPENEKTVNAGYYYDSYAMNIRDLVFPSDMYIAGSARLIMTKSQKAEEYKEFMITTGTRDSSYYVFNNGGYSGEFISAGKAIVSVSNDSSGLVVDSNGNVVYRALDATEYNTVADYINEYPCKKKKDTLMTCAYMCIEYLNSDVSYEEVMKYKTWEEAFVKLTDGVGLNISGIDLQTALYFLDRDVPFAACIDDGRYVLVISYNSTHIRYYDPMLGEEVRLKRSEFETLLSMQGNTMYTYTSQ